MRSNFGRFSYPLRIKGLWQILWLKNGQFLPKIGKLGGGSRKYPLNLLESKGNFRVLLQMASDSEGLRPLSSEVPQLRLSRVANGFRFGRVTTLRTESQTQLTNSSRLQMASDSEGLRHSFRIFCISFSDVANGFRFGRVTTFGRFHLFFDQECCKWLPIRKGYDILVRVNSNRIFHVANGFRFGRVTTCYEKVSNS